MTHNGGKSRFAGLEAVAPPNSRGRGGAVVRDADFYLAAALERELNGEHAKALNQYSAALGEDPLCIGAWTRQLWMLLYLDEAIEATTWADKALQAFPNDPDILSLKSLALWRNGMTEDARTLNDAALAATRNSANVWLARGAMQIGLNMKSAMACFKHAENAPGMAGLTQLRAGDILLHAGKHAEATGYYRGATGALPDSSWAWYGYGRAQRALGHSAYAHSAFSRACNLSPTDTRYRVALRAKPGIFAWLRNRLFSQ